MGPDGDACDVGVDEKETEDVPQRFRQDDEANNDEVEATIRKTADGEDEEYSSDSAVVTTGMDVWIYQERWEMTQLSCEAHTQLVRSSCAALSRLIWAQIRLAISQSAETDRDSVK